jgi:hypothetical protein
MGVEKSLIEGCKAAIESINLADQRVMRWTNLKRELLVLALNHNVISKEDILGWVTERIFAIGVEMADHSKRTKEWADHVPSREALAYALAHKQIPKDKTAWICFDDGDTAESFMRGRVDNLPEEVLEQLLGAPTPSTAYFDEGIICADGGPCTCGD